MSRLALLTVLAMTATSAADPPYYGQDSGPYYGDRYRDEGRRGDWHNPYGRDPYDTYGDSSRRPSDPRERIPIARIADRRSQHLITVNQLVDRLVLEGTAGATFVRRVSVEYADHSIQDFPLETQLLPGQRLTLPLSGRLPVYRMEVVTDKNRGAYEILGERGGYARRGGYRPRR